MPTRSAGATRSASSRSCGRIADEAATSLDRRGPVPGAVRRRHDRPGRGLAAVPRPRRRRQVPGDRSAPRLAGAGPADPLADGDRRDLQRPDDLRRSIVPVRPSRRPRPADLSRRRQRQGALARRVRHRLRRHVPVRRRPEGVAAGRRRPGLHLRRGGPAARAQGRGRCAALGDRHDRAVRSRAELLRGGLRAGGRRRSPARADRRQSAGLSGHHERLGQEQRHRRRRLRQAHRRRTLSKRRRAGLLRHADTGDDRRPPLGLRLRPGRLARSRTVDGQGRLPVPVAVREARERQRGDAAGRRRHRADHRELWHGQRPVADQAEGTRGRLAGSAEARSEPGQPLGHADPPRWRRLRGQRSRQRRRRGPGPRARDRQGALEHARARAQHAAVGRRPPDRPDRAGTSAGATRRAQEAGADRRRHPDEGQIRGRSRGDSRGTAAAIPGLEPTDPLPRSAVRDRQGSTGVSGPAAVGGAGKARLDSGDRREVTPKIVVFGRNGVYRRWPGSRSPSNFHG